MFGKVKTPKKAPKAHTLGFSDLASLVSVADNNCAKDHSQYLICEWSIPTSVTVTELPLISP
jgi:hypothetical protein